VDRTLAGSKKKAEAEGWTIVWVDETGVCLLPTVVRTWAPRGQTPVLTAPLSKAHLSAIGAITAEGRVLCRVVEDRALTGVEVVRFLRHLLQHLPGKLLVLWDGASIHHGETVKTFLRAGGAQRLHLERLPGYAPDLNPAEGLWRLVKRRELKNLVCDALWELRLEFRQALARLRHRPDLIRACVAHAGYSL
jgi:transposase